MPRKATPLSDRDRIFVAEVLANGGHYAAAHRVAYPDWKGQESSRKDIARGLAIRKDIRAVLNAAHNTQVIAVTEVMDRYGVTRERLAQAMAWLAFTDYTQVMDLSVGSDGKVTARPKSPQEIPLEARFAICGLRCKPNGEVIEYVLPDRRACTMDLGRLLGLIQDKPIETKQMVMLKIER